MEIKDIELRELHREPEKYDQKEIFVRGWIRQNKSSNKSPFALAAMDLLGVDSPEHTLDVISVVEATLDDPRPLLYAQQRQARGEAVAAMKAEGMDYEERMAALEEIAWPRPLAELLEPALEMYRQSNA